MHASYENNERLVIERLDESFRQNFMKIAPMNVNGTVRLFKALGENEKAQALIDLYVENREDGIFDRTHLFSAEDLSDVDFASAFDRRAAAVVDKRDPATVVSKIAEDRGWSDQDTALLATLDAAKMKEILKGLTDGRGPKVARDLLSFAHSGEAGAAVAATTRLALQEVAAESKLNAWRVRGLGVQDLG